MHRPETEQGAAASLPAFGSAGTDGFFTRGNPATSTLATDWTEELANDLWQNLYKLFSEASHTAVKGVDTDIVAAIRKLRHRDYVLIVDEKSAGTAGGTFTSGAWRTRDLNTEKVDLSGLASIASNQITLAAGTYLVRIKAPATGVNLHKARLQNITDAATELWGTPSENTTTENGSSDSIIVGVITLAASKTLEVQHYSDVTGTSIGFGSQGPSGGGGVETYTVVEFWRIA